MTAIADLPTGLPGRVTALAILIAGIAALYVGIAAPLVALYYDREAQLSTERRREARLRDAAAEMPQLRAVLARLRQSADGGGITTLDGASDALAAAGLQSRIEELAAGSGVAIASTEGLPVETAGNYRRIGLRLAIGGAYDGIIKLLSAIDATTPPLLVDSLQIRGNTRIASSREATRLDAGLVLYGLRNGDAQAGVKP